MELLCVTFYKICLNKYKLTKALQMCVDKYSRCLYIDVSVPGVSVLDFEIDFITRFDAPNLTWIALYSQIRTVNV